MGGGGGTRWHCGWEWGRLSRFLPHRGRGRGGGNQLQFPLPSLHLCSLALLPCLVYLGCWCATLGCVHSARGDCVGNAPALSPRAARSSSREARGERCRDRSRSVGSWVRTLVSRSSSTSRSRSSGRDHSRRSSSHSPSVRSRPHRHRSWSSDRCRYREVRSCSRGTT